MVYDPTGAPMAGVPIGLRRQRFDDARVLTRTDERGRFHVELDGPGWLQPIGSWHHPIAHCVAVPEGLQVRVPEGSRAQPWLKGLDFIVPQMCAVPVEVSGIDGAVELWSWTPRGVHLVDIVDAPGSSVVTMPCDTGGIVGLHDSAVSLADPTPCDAPQSFRCFDHDGIDLPMREQPPVRGVVRRAGGAPVRGALVEGLAGRTQTDDEGRFSLPRPESDAWSMRVLADGMRPVHTRADGTPVHGTLEDGLWSVELQRARVVEVRCAGLPDELCSAVPTCRGVDEVESTPCRHVRSFGKVCDCPGGPSILEMDGYTIEIGADDAVAWFDLRQEGHTLRGSGLSDHCGVYARRESAPGDALGVSGLTMQITECEEGGRFTLAALAAGTWTLDIVRGSRVSYTVKVRGSRLWRPPDNFIERSDRIDR